MTFDGQTTPGARRVHQDVGHRFSVHTYEWDATGGTNDYAEGDWTETTSEVTATISFPESPTLVTGPDGDDVEIAATITLNPNDASVVEGTGDQTRATEFVDEETGHRYRAVTTTTEQPLLAVECERL